MYYSYKMGNQHNSPKKLVILGSTGSIGQQTLDVIRALPHKFKVIGLAAGSNIELLNRQIQEFKPRMVFYQNQELNPKPDYCEFVPLEQMACHPDVDLVVIATSGKAGLLPTIEAIRCGKKIALSNKEPLVMAGEIILGEIKKRQNRQPVILPVDSEHSAIWQCLNGEAEKPARIILTASGGPFLNYSLDQMENVTVEQALQHPSWKMGKKVTIDSATLMNKGLEVIEAHWLFEMPYDRIEILIHPQSIIHSMVEMADGCIKAQLSVPDMRFPIQYALTYPERIPNSTLPILKLDQVKNLQFAKPDYHRFPCLRLAIEAGKTGGTYPAVLCGADEVAVDLFLQKRIRLTDIARLVEKVMSMHSPVYHPDFDTIMEAENWARKTVKKLLNGAN